MIRQAAFSLGLTLAWGFWVQGVSLGVTVIGTIVVVAAAPTGADDEHTT